MRVALKNISREIEGNAAGGFYARGLASEGYAGGYRDALSDIDLLLNGVVPNRRGYWEPIKSDTERPADGRSPRTKRTP